MLMRLVGALGVLATGLLVGCRERNEAPRATDRPTPWPFTLDPTRRLFLDPSKVIQEERLAKDLLGVLPIPSRSCQEIEFTEFARNLLESQGTQTSVDDLPEKAARRGPGLNCNNGTIPPNSGNLIAFLPATDLSLPSWNLSFHLDTNQTKFEGFTREGDLIKPPPGSPLGADDKAGFTIIVEVLRTIQENKIPHGDIRIVGLVGEEDNSAGASFIEGEAFQDDILVSVDGTNPDEIGRAAPTMYNGNITVRTTTSHPAEIDNMKSVSACAVGARILYEAGFRPDGHPPGQPEVILHSYFSSCGEDTGEKTEKGNPLATFKHNTVSPFWTAAWQMRHMGGKDAAETMVEQLKTTVKRVCEEVGRGRTPVRCDVIGGEWPGLIGYTIDENDPALQILKSGWKAIGGKRAEITAKQFGGFNGNVLFARFGKKVILLGTGARQIHTNEETVSIKGMGRVARGLLASMLESYRYRRQ